MISDDFKTLRQDCFSAEQYLSLAVYYAGFLDIPFIARSSVSNNFRQLSCLAFSLYRRAMNQ